MNKLIYRTIDANLNRVREGLRVCEEFVRFFSNDRALTEDYKMLRNKLGLLYKKTFHRQKTLLLARDAAGDVGRIAFAFEKTRAKPQDIFWANIQRSKEALRVLEEFSKLLDKDLSDEFRRLRFKTYELEKATLKKMQTLFGPR